MTTVYRIELLVVDHDRLGAIGVGEAIEDARYGNRCISPSVISVEGREVEWSDEHPLNHGSTQKAALAELFAPVDAREPASPVVPPPTTPPPLLGFSREDLTDVADSLDSGHERTVNVGDATGEGLGDTLIESTTAYAARFIRTVLAASPVVTEPVEAEREPVTVPRLTKDEVHQLWMKVGYVLRMYDEIQAAILAKASALSTDTFVLGDAE